MENFKNVSYNCNPVPWCNIWIVDPQAKVAELQGREAEWERERASLRELITTLKDDRLFYKETAEKKE